MPALVLVVAPRRAGGGIIDLADVAAPARARLHDIRRHLGPPVSGGARYFGMREQTFRGFDLKFRAPIDPSRICIVWHMNTIIIIYIIYIYIPTAM